MSVASPALLRHPRQHAIHREGREFTHPSASAARTDGVLAGVRDDPRRLATVAGEPKEASRQIPARGDRTEAKSDEGGYAAGVAVRLSGLDEAVEIRLEHGGHNRLARVARAVLHVPRACGWGRGHRRQHGSAEPRPAGLCERGNGRRTARAPRRRRARVTRAGRFHVARESERRANVNGSCSGRRANLSRPKVGR